MKLPTDAQNDTAPSGDVLPTLIYDIVRHRGHWRVLHAGKHSNPHADQQAATAAAILAARQGHTASRSVLVRLNRTDGHVLELDLAADAQSAEP
jgi:hypothetical protein